MLWAVREAGVLGCAFCWSQNKEVFPQGPSVCRGFVVNILGDSAFVMFQSLVFWDFVVCFVLSKSSSLLRDRVSAIARNLSYI